MQRDLHSNTRLAPGRLSPLRMLAFLLLAGLLWSWGQAHAASLSFADNELGYFIMQESGLENAHPGAVSPDADEACRKPVQAKAGLTEQVLHEVGDLGGVQSLQPVWLLPALAAPVQRPQPTLQEAEHRPPLRPPAPLG